MVKGPWRKSAKLKRIGPVQSATENREIRRRGQKRIKNSHVTMTGIGGPGCASATYLIAAGVGRITIVDFDVVKLSDLYRLGRGSRNIQRDRG